MSDRIIRIPEFLQKSGLTRAGMYRKRDADPNFPTPIRLSERTVGFSENEADTYVQHLINTRGEVSAQS